MYKALCTHQYNNDINTFMKNADKQILTISYINTL